MFGFIGRCVSSKDTVLLLEIATNSSLVSTTQSWTDVSTKSVSFLSSWILSLQLCQLFVLTCKQILMYTVPDIAKILCYL